jgi:Ala-tRNA(Pro) deacylase
MSIAPTFQQYLTAENVKYDVIPHEPTMSSTQTAEACRISKDCLAKGVVLRRDRDGGYLLAVLPASRHVRLSDLRDQFGEDVEMAEEAEVDRLFWDCAHGAIPPVGRCYGLPVVVDDRIDAQPEIYMEAGDHRTLLHMGHAQFARMTADARYGRFSERLSEKEMTSVVWG